MKKNGGDGHVLGSIIDLKKSKEETEKETEKETKEETKKEK